MGATRGKTVKEMKVFARNKQTWNKQTIELKSKYADTEDCKQILGEKGAKQIGKDYCFNI